MNAPPKSAAIYCGMLKTLPFESKLYDLSKVKVYF